MVGYIYKILFVYIVLCYVRFFNKLKIILENVLV